MEKKIKTIIVDDEQEAREGVNLLLKDDPDIEVIAICKNGIEAIEALTSFRIDLMFLDIQMPLVDGFEVIRSIADDRIPVVIFITAFDQYAVRAFEVQAIDYLLKPFTDKRFFEAISHAKDAINKKELKGQANKLKDLSEGVLKGKGSEGSILIHSGSGKGQLSNKLIVKEGGKIHFIDLVDIIWIEAFDYYVKIHVMTRFYLVRESMKNLTNRLPDSLFARIHKSSIINLSCIRSIELKGNREYEVHLNSGKTLKVSRGYKDSIKHMI